MSPRNYRQTKRRAMTELTQQRIIEATVALHAEKGIVATTVTDIAQRADVGVGTIYYHYPTYDDIVRACGAHVRAVTRPPQPAALDGVEPFERRIECLVQELFAYYERYPSFERGRCDQDKLPVLAEAVARREQALRTFVQEAYKSVRHNQKYVRMTLALTDFAVYRALTGQGLSAMAAAAQVTEVLLAWLKSNLTPASR